MQEAEDVSNAPAQCSSSTVPLQSKSLNGTSQSPRLFGFVVHQAASSVKDSTDRTPNAVALTLPSERKAPGPEHVAQGRAEHCEIGQVPKDGVPIIDLGGQHWTVWSQRWGIAALRRQAS